MPRSIRASVVPYKNLGRAIRRLASSTAPMAYHDSPTYESPEVLAKYAETPLLPKPWSWQVEPSCQWSDQWAFGLEIPHVSREFSLEYDISSPIESLAFIPHSPEPMFVFTAGGRYYSLDERGLLRFNSKFVSNDDFLARFEREIDYGTTGIGILTQDPIYSGLEVKPLAHGVPVQANLAPGSKLVPRGQEYLSQYHALRYPDPHALQGANFLATYSACRSRVHGPATGGAGEQDPS
ncbi:hypothetical protein C8F04DRAFT_1194745 [Mycena alexandri]|uniref:Uncharacterized protein n=1 Tax=Mycena alexandri TaxID=1745969 RepID=A0AAD6WPG4_9AGAR|nr:hypothetical protein C8F04DRAFT_1194745 [Mycena alexandri]